MVRKERKNAQKPPFSLLVQFRMPGAIYRPWHSSQGLAAFQGPLGHVGGHTRAIKLGPADVSNFVLMHFSSSNFGRTFWGLLGLVLRRYWFPRKLWMSIFIKLKKLKIQRLVSMLMHFSQFSQYLNRFNFYFNTWIIVGMRIWLSSLWHWFQSILASRSKLVFLDPPKIDSKSNLVKVAKNLRGAQVRYKTMKNVVLWGFWPCLTFGQPKADQGHFGHFGLKWYFERSSVQMGYAMPLYMFSWPQGEKKIFLGFLGFGMQFEGGQNTVSTHLRGPSPKVGFLSSCLSLNHDKNMFNICNLTHIHTTHTCIYTNMASFIPKHIHFNKKEPNPYANEKP